MSVDVAASDFDLARYQDVTEIQRLLHNAGTIAIVPAFRSEICVKSRRSGLRASASAPQKGELS